VSVSNKQTTSNELDPDVRFLLANERTLLAWIRTAIAVIAGGVALTQFGSDSTIRVATGVGAIVLGISLASYGYARFKDADKAIRRGELPQGYDIMNGLNKLILGRREIRRSDV
jgi:putative membrane protein